MLEIELKRSKHHAIKVLILPLVSQALFQKGLLNNSQGTPCVFNKIILHNGQAGRKHIGVFNISNLSIKTGITKYVVSE